MQLRADPTHGSRLVTLPNFIVLGAAKAGTTALYSYLKPHPEIYLTPFKETKFFAHEGEELAYTGPRDRELNSRLVNNLAAYEALYDGVTTEKAIGEICPPYLYFPKACERIKHYVPDAKLFIILRNPVDRAYSSFLHLLRDGREPIQDFGLALREEEKRIQANYAPLWFYQDMGRYYGQVKRYVDEFGWSQLHVSLYEDFEADPAAYVKNMCGILGVSDSFVPDVSIKWNVSGVPKNKLLHRAVSSNNKLTSLFDRIPGGLWLRRRIRQGNLGKPAFPIEARRMLIESLRDDILKLQELLQRDLSNWLVEK